MRYARLGVCVLVGGLVTAGPAEAAFPGDNGKIAFVSHDLSVGRSYIATMSPSGGDRTRLTTFGDEGYPAWSANGGKIAYDSRASGNFEIYSMNADGTDKSRLTDEPAYDAEPAWSPDGQKIAFRSDRSGTADVYVMDANGTGLTRLTNDPAYDTDPAWSPDGQKIAFGSNRGGNNDVYVMNANGSGLTRLTTDPSADIDPNWSPDGQKILFGSYRNGGQVDQYTMTASGADETQLTSSSSHDYYGAWSPDGQKIVFTRGCCAAEEIYTMDAAGGGEESITPDLRPSYQPDWQPIPHGDTVAPALSVPDTITTSATSAVGAVVSYTATATDDVDPSPAVSCTPASGSTFPLGTTTVACTATDAAGNTASGNFVVRVEDTVAPVLSVPATITRNATGPLGATVTYTVTASDDVDPNPAVGCTPASGSTFAVGTTTVACTANDAAGNTAHASFTVRIKGANEQIDDLIDRVVDRLRLPPGPAAQLATNLKAATSALVARNKPLACRTLDRFKLTIRAAALARLISPADAAALVADVDRIEAVLGC